VAEPEIAAPVQPQVDALDPLFAITELDFKTKQHKKLSISEITA